MEETFKKSEEYQSYLAWLQKVRESRTTAKFLLGGSVETLQAAQLIDQQANELISTMPLLEAQINKMKDEELVQLGLQYIEQMVQNKDENAQTFAQYFQINPLGTSKLILALMYKAQSERNSSSPRNLRVARPAASMNGAPSAMARKGLKIMELNGHCPEGYEIQYYSVGGNICGKCLKKKKLLLQNMACGGKKRIKKGEKGLTQARAESLKYKGGPGDANSTEGLKPNTKQKRMLMKKIGGMVNNAKKITIFQQPDMIDYVKI